MTVATLILATIAALAALAARRHALAARVDTLAASRRLREVHAAVYTEPEPDSLVGKAVLISTTGSTAVSGIVHADLPGVRLTLRDATVLTVGSDAEAPAQGLLHLYLEHIDLVQELPIKPADAATAEE